MSISTMPRSVRHMRMLSGLNGWAEPMGRSARISRIRDLVVAKGSKNVFLTDSIVDHLQRLMRDQGYTLVEIRIAMFWAEFIR